MSFSPFERMMAWRYLRARKAEGFVSVIAGFSFLGIMLGVATLIIVMSVMNGFREELVGRILGLNGHLNVYSANGPIYNYPAMVNRIQNTAGVESVRPMVEGQVLVSVNGVASGAMVRGFTPEDFASKPIISTSVQAGSLEDFHDNRVAIGNEMARKMNVKVGDNITILSPKGKATPFGTVPRSGAYTVALIFDVGMYEYNSGFIFMPLDTAQKFFQMEDAVNTLEIMAKSIGSIDRVKSDIRYAVQDDAQVYDWRDSNKSFINALNVERNVMFLILTLIIIVAAFNIISSMIMLVKDKGKDIAIMRTMGATRSTMLKIFILTGASIGFAGTFAGALLGMSFALNIESIRQFLQGLTNTELFSSEIYFLSKLPAVVEWQEVATVVGMALVISIAATIYPAWRASRLDPVEALRYE
ncbi:MAG: lipoprotein-releasing ABC transporter permease subunit [Micavibrio aeruginosavorus]|uniref:Lipoprotein-releasing ABC transporter permease subunit n=1 Tax=Micavibrio aeruginosavorus TaxID=349221 RepID=A0A2W5A3E4_9BACT|nr:MAG: lipoprotein-releasing ABC transporter permease subunit [Micavibrio aeruginosavorus]